MPTLSRDHRRLLENTVAQARTIAVDGARKVLTDQYAVHHHEPWPHMTAEERELRNQLRAHGRQLGDRRDDRRDTQEIDHLVQACAYEHWHRMLFARFLAENDLLLDADHGMAMSLEEVRELAREQNRDWLEIAAELAQKMLLAVFRPDDPVLRVSLPPETRQELEAKLEALPAAVFQADDSLGWVYQFWQRDEKDRVNKSELKIGADELPAVTQLFTEDYMVLFLLENTLGAWWTAKRRAEGKDPVLSGYDWTYLRLNEDGSPAAGPFDGWPRLARDVRVLDPSMGSGHFLTFALPILARMRVAEEGLSLQDSVAAVLRDNLHGLELDARCSQIAAFNLALAAWRLAGGYFHLPSLNLACSGLGINASAAEWEELAGQDGRKRDLLKWVFSMFTNAPTLGSLIDPLAVGKTMFEAELRDLLPLVEQALGAERTTDESRELAIAAKGILTAGRMLTKSYSLVVTNVPYLARGKQSAILANHCEAFYSDAKADLSTSFVDRCLRLCENGGSIALVTPQNWLFLASYRSFRERLLRTACWDFVCRLGTKAFQTPMWDFNVMLVALSRTSPLDARTFLALELGDEAGAAEKAREMPNRQLLRINQGAQLRNPQSKVMLVESNSTQLLSHYASSYQGIKTGDDERVRRCFWELDRVSDRWRFFQSTTDQTAECGGMEGIIDWQDDGRGLARRQGMGAWGKRGVMISQTGQLYASLYFGECFDSNASPIVPTRQSDIGAIWSYCSSPAYAVDVRNVDQSLKPTNTSLVQVPFDRSHWSEQFELSHPLGFPTPTSEEPTQWLFHGDPTLSSCPLQVAICRLLGYEWPRQTGSSFLDCPSLASDRLDPHTDKDGIVPLIAIAGEASAADRLRALLVDAYGSEWSAVKLQELLGKWDSLEDWLRDRCFEEHCGVFHNRPFVWHIWDGRKDGFHVLVNYHKLAGPNGEGRKTLEKLIFTYLGRWIDRQNDEIRTGKEGADARLAAGLHLKTELERILTGEKPYDLFVRWKPIHEQPIGWAPNINDGVRLNIRPWLLAKPYQAGRRDGCILRVTPRVNFGKDRGKEPHRPKEDFPWFWSWDEQSDDFLGGKDFDGARWNDLHYSLDAKRKARELRKHMGTKA